MPPPIANPYQSCYSNSYASFQVPSAMEGCSCHKEQHGESWIAECWVTEDVFELNLTYREHVTDPRWNDESGEEI